MKKYILVITFGVTLFFAFYHVDQLIKVAKFGLNLILPFVLGGCIAFILNVLLRMLEKLWDKLFSRCNGKRLKPLFNAVRRPICLTLSFLLILGLIFAVFYIIIPQIVRTVTEIVTDAPALGTRIETWWNGLREQVKGMVALPALKIDFDRITKYVTTFLNNEGTVFFNKTVSVTTSVASGVFNIVLAVFFSVYILMQKEKLIRNSRTVLFAYVPKKYADRIVETLRISNISFTNFVTGQFTEAIIIGCLCFIGMVIFRFPYAAMISVLVGFTALIPMFGAFIGTAVGALFILMESPIKAIWFVIFIIILQQLEGNLIYPKVVGKSVGLPGIWVLVAVTVGGTAFGIGGMLLSVPLFSVFYTLMRRAVIKRAARGRCAEQKENTPENPAN